MTTDITQGKESIKIFLDNEAFLVKKFSRNIDLFTVREILEFKKKIDFVFVMKDGFKIEKEEEFDFTLNEILDEDKIYLKSVKNNHPDSNNNTTKDVNNYNLINSMSNTSNNLKNNGQIIDKPPADIPNSYNNQNNNSFQNNSNYNNNQNINFSQKSNFSNNFTKNNNYSQNNKALPNNNYPQKKFTSNDPIYQNNNFQNNNFLQNNNNNLQNNNFTHNNNCQNNNIFPNNNFTQNINMMQNKNFPQNKIILQNNNFLPNNNSSLNNNNPQNNNFIQYNNIPKNNNNLQNNNFSQNINMFQNFNSPQNINMLQNINSPQNTNMLQNNNFGQKNIIPQNVKYLQNLNMAQNNNSFQNNNIHENYNFSQNNNGMFNDQFYNNNNQINTNLKKDNGINTKIIEKFNVLHDEIKKINKNLNNIKYENENEIKPLNVQTPTIGITNFIKLKIYINGNFKFEKEFIKDMPLEKIREEIFKEIKCDFFFLLPDGFIISKEEEKIFSLEGILNKNRLYIIILKNEKKISSNNNKNTNENDEQYNDNQNNDKNIKKNNTFNKINEDNNNVDTNNGDNNRNKFINKIDENERNDNNNRTEKDKEKLNKLKHNCKKLENIGDLEIYLYPQINFSSKEKQNSINFMVVGQTGSGKTTLLNAFLNYLLGVEYDDNFRFKLIHEDFGISMAESQTKDVTIYNIRPLDNTIPLIAVIDTPGFGDTGGIEKDKLIADKIAEKFQSEISHINAICFVAQSTNSKLTINQKYIFNSIMDLFSDDIKENFIAMLTFCNIIDDNPVILEPLKKKGSGFDLVLPAIENTQWYFLFDNLAVFKSKENKKLNNKIKNFYGFAMDNFDEFMTKLLSLRKKRLTNTKKVLDNRKFLESRIKILEEMVRNCLNKIDEFMQTYNIVQNYYNELQNKNFIYTVMEMKSRKVPTSHYKGGGGQYFTTCLICSHTCHPGCFIDSNDRKKECSAMDLSTGKCKVCKKKCDWSSHENRDYFWEEYQEPVQKTDEFLKAKYVKKESEKSAKEQILEGLEIDISRQNFELINTQEEMKDVINELKKIALNKDVFESAEEHIDLLIENEKFERKPGWQKRIEAFNILKRQKIQLRQIYQGRHTDANKIQEFVKNFNKKELQKKSREKCNIF